MCHVCKRNSALITGPWHAGCPFWQGVQVQRAMIQLFLGFEQPGGERDPPGAMCSQVFQQLFHKSRAVGCTLFSLLREGLPLSPLPVSCPPAPEGFCSPQDDLQGNNLLPFPKECWKTRHHTDPMTGEDLGKLF